MVELKSNHRHKSSTSRRFSKHFWIGVLLLVGSFCGKISGVQSPFLYRRCKSLQSENFQTNAVYKTKTAAQCIAKCGFLPYCFGVEFHTNSGDCHISETPVAMPTKYNSDVISMIPRILPKVTHILIIGGLPDKRDIWEYIPETKSLTKKEITLPQVFAYFHHAKYTSAGFLYIIIEYKSPTPIVLIKANPLSIENNNLATSFATRLNYMRCGYVSVDGQTYFSLSQGKIHKYDIENNYLHSEISNSKIPQAGFTCHFIDDRVFIFGGEGVFETSLNEINLISGVTNYSGTLPHNYLYHESVWFQNGVVLCASYYSPRKRCDNFVINSKTWVDFPDLNYGRYLMSLIEWNDKILAFGGRLDFTPIVEVSDGSNWEKFDNQTQFDGMHAFEAVNIGKF